MALVKCKECSEEISKNAKSCPKCGTNKNRSFISNHPILSIIFLLMCIAYLPNILFKDDIEKLIEENKITEIKEKEEIKKMVQNELKSTSKNEVIEEQKEIKKMVQNEVIEEQKDIKDNNWEYSIEEDKMRNSKIVFATIYSTNNLNLGFPHNNSKMKIIIRKMNGEVDVIIKVKGVFSCGYKENCAIKIKADQNEIVEYEYSEAANGNYDTVFIDDTYKFIEMIKKSKNIIIESKLYNNGAVQYEFDVSGLEWNE